MVETHGQIARPANEEWFELFLIFVYFCPERMERDKREILHVSFII